MKNTFFILAAALLSHAASATISCGVIVEGDPMKRPGVYDKTLIDLTMPDKPDRTANRRTLVAKDQQSAKELTDDEIAKRDSENNWKDIDGQLIYKFQYFDEDEYSIVMTTVDASVKSSEMNDKIVAGGSIVPDKSWVQLGNPKKKIWAGCATKAEDVKQ